MSNFIGRTIGRYHVTELLGKGGMASVYKAFDTRLERYVAIKFIRADALNQETFLKRFEREAKALAKLSHPNIVKVLDYGTHEEVPYIVMEYIPGGTLKQKLGRPYSPVEAARLVLPIARTLDYTHRQNIIHRDVKPANFLMMDSGEPMLSDFGISRVMEQSDAAPLTSTGAGIGTPEYMAPEQCRGEKVDQRADIYSLGVVFYELVTGAKPFSADTPMAVVMKQITEPVPSARLYAPGIPVEVEQILQKALAKRPEDRFQSMAQFAAALERILQESATSPAHMTVKKADSQPQPAAPPIPQPVYNFPAQQSAPQPRPVKEPERKKSNLGLWIGGGVVGLMLCIALIAVLVLGGSLLGGQQNVSITATAQSLAQTIQANEALRTQEAIQQTGTAEAMANAEALSAEQTLQAQNQTGTAQVEQQNRDATGTAEAQIQLETQTALDALQADLQDARQNWSTDFSDGFTNPDNWNTGNYESEWWQGTKNVTSGRFIWEMEALRGFYHYVTANDTLYSNFLVSVRCGQTSGHENGEVGLVLMELDNNKYYFTINSTTQRYEFILFNDGEWTTLDTNKVDSIQSSNLNQVEILVENNSFTIYINGEYINQVDNDALTQGEIAVTAGLSNGGETATFEFDDFTIQVP